MKTLTSALAVILLLAACSSSTDPDDQGGATPITELPRSLTTAEVELLQSSNEFGFDLLREIHSESPGENVFISPLSASMALGMALNGSAGTTFDAMSETLRFEGLTLAEINDSYRSLIDLLSDLDPNVSFHIGNSVWHRTGWTPRAEYLARVSDAFDAEIAGLDFSSPSAAGVINAWVSDATDGRIEEIVEAPISELTVAFLINAIDFEGLWTTEFDSQDSRQGTFYNEDGTTGTVRLMERDGLVDFASASTYDAIELPYGGQAYAMTIVVPREGTSVAELAGDLNASGWASLTGSFAERDIVIRIPSFEMEWEASLNDFLEAMGMGIAFDPANADFTELFANARENQVHISNVKQKTFIEVDESGTRASAATSVEVGVTSYTPPFVVDRPFLFAIRERLSGTILFVGTIVEAPE